MKNQSKKQLLIEARGLIQSHGKMITAERKTKYEQDMKDYKELMQKTFQQKVFDRAKKLRDEAIEAEKKRKADMEERERLRKER